MVTIQFEVDNETHAVLETAARLRGVTLDVLLHDVLAQSLQEMKDYMDDPLIGMARSGRGDLSERDEDLLEQGWNPD